MKLCIPVIEDKGLDSQVSAHFGSAPLFMMIDTESGDCRPLVNGNQHHAHGMCSPLAALAGQPVDGVAVGGIGMGALMKLQAAGIEVYRSEHATARETLEAFKAGSLQKMDPGCACAGHAGGHECGHH